ncbi:MAG: hypothetical protein Q7T16_03555 [Candidatus Burarchaeum sp.]|nr:hypothetical protein [Candidatus Burarchaeum sp.]MDO8339707.1 hypothetical protein [Candidatus Burarchaeum sp.]
MDKYNPPKLIILRSHLDVDTVNEDGIPCFAPSPYSPKETKALRALDSMKNVHSITPCFEHNDWLKMLLK